MLIASLLLITPFNSGTNFRKEEAKKTKEKNVGNERKG
jgi:hypothetical protein